ncbi:MAG: Nin-like protein [Planctomycetota bacterium]|nr:Nin-like protein [Planctomycetota bacterium]
MNPYLLDRPAVVSFSGGRTSGFMLWNILQAFGGKLPDEVLVCFQNTGLEHEATYAFVERVSEEWSVPIHWLEYRVTDGEHDYAEVTPATASRKGEPFDALIQKKGYLPNPRSRICTTNLKMRTLDRHLKTQPAFLDGYTNAVGLRYDEPRRVHRLKADNAREEMACPMYKARHTEEDVLAFWRRCALFGFDLDLPYGNNTFGNCVGCFLKSKAKLELIAETQPGHIEWWAGAEALKITDGPGGKFRLDREPYARLLERVREQGRFDWPEEEADAPCMCHD